MIAVDTNVILRYLLDDDKQQSHKAAKLFTRHERILILDVVLVELVWTLKGKKYQLNKEDIILVITKLFEEPNVIFEDDKTVWRALKDYAKAPSVKVGNKKKSADFPDALIINKAQYYTTPENSVVTVYTFDQTAQCISGANEP
ncbi:MAG: PIN domain-containing protein [Endozoicomonas sp.]|uniref:PIN domain-containing protein n=1 Tax=Endozoicomonas sp. TaxID=1892382 RepID=UPI003D9BB918